MSTLSIVTTLGKFVEERKRLLESLKERLEENEERFSTLRYLYGKAVANFETDYNNHLEQFSSDIIEIFKREAISQLIASISDESFFGKVIVYLGGLLGDKTRFVRNYTSMLGEELYSISYRYASINDILKIETIKDFSKIDENSYKFPSEYKFKDFNNFLNSWGIPTMDIDEPIRNIRMLRSDIKECEEVIKEILSMSRRIIADLKTFDMPCYYENECTVSLDSSGKELLGECQIKLQEYSNILDKGF